MIRMIKTTVLILIIIAAFGAAYAQKPDTTKANDKTDIKVLEERVRQNDEKISDLENDREQRFENRIDEFDAKLKDQKDDLNGRIDDKIANVKEIHNLSLYFGGLILSLLVAIISFIGYRRIISTIRKVIEEKTVAELEASWADSFEEFLKDKTEELENKWESRLKDVENKWTNYGESLKKTMAKIENQTGISRISDIPSEDLKEFLYRLDKVKKEKEYSAYDWHIKGYNDAQKGEYETAIEFYTKSIKLNAKDASVYYNRGNSNQKLKKFELAIEDYNTAIELNPEHTNAYNNRGISNRKLTKYELAIEDYDIAIKLNPEDTNAYFNRGVTYYYWRKYEPAIEDYNKAIELNPKDISAYKNIAELFIVLGENEGALETIKKALKLDKTTDDEAILVYLKCIAYKLLNRETTEIVIEFNEILSKDLTTTWDFEEIERWLAEADLPEDTRKFIEEKTAMLKKKME